MTDRQRPVDYCCPAAPSAGILWFSFDEEKGIPAGGAAGQQY